MAAKGADNPHVCLQGTRHAELDAIDAMLAAGHQAPFKEYVMLAAQQHFGTHTETHAPAGISFCASSRR